MSLSKLEEHRAIWAGKPSLRAIYETWFARLLRDLPHGARVLEAGAGPGLLASYARAQRPDLVWWASDLIAAPWNDLAADAVCLPFAEGSLDAVVGLDVLHHLSHPRDFFAEAARVLRPGGQVTMIEPWITPLAALVYLFHDERCHFRVKPWAPYAAGREKDAFEGDSALVWALVRRPRAEWTELGFEAPVVRSLNAFAWLLSLGFKRASLLPDRATAPLLRLDELTAPLARLLGVRVHVGWRRAGRPATGGAPATTSSSAG